ncbi:LysR family transcriptional regulator [Plasticicumulans acidivorans]|uniref:LysR family transcriptional regulator n=1 Tax=Plasticicumulans acidivorans TaxID=886464 RepID=A0A317MZT3_9GAMM|nr:LysR family transcriptional regulator [Plasticicumulans acidivorans]PWV64626.1 LysR family transcriptional regulator [Plasticicumulans acidivorans]
MDTEELRVFVEVMRRGSFAAVARERRVDPSSISRMIAGLERALGLRLFQRSTRRLVPTEAGELYFRRVEPLVEALARAALEAGDIGAAPRGLLRVTSSVAFGHELIVPRLAEFCARYPALQVELRLTDELLDLLAERIDLAVRVGPLADSSLVARPLLRTRYVVCASPEYLARRGRPARPAELAGHACLRYLLPGAGPLWRFRDAAGVEEAVAIDGPLLCSSALALRECTRHGAGIALIADWLVREDLRSGRLLDLLPDYHAAVTEFDPAAWLVYPSRDYLPLKVRAFEAHLRAGLTPA